MKLFPRPVFTRVRPKDMTSQGGGVAMETSQSRRDADKELRET